MVAEDRRVLLFSEGSRVGGGVLEAGQEVADDVLHETYQYGQVRESCDPLEPQRTLPDSYPKETADLFRAGRVQGWLARRFGGRVADRVAFRLAVAR